MTMDNEIDSSLRTLLAHEDTTHPLPSPKLLWWKAQVHERRRLQQKATLPIRVLRLLSAIAVFAIAGAIMYAELSQGAIYLVGILFTSLLFVAIQVAIGVTSPTLAKD